MRKYITKPITTEKQILDEMSCDLCDLCDRCAERLSNDKLAFMRKPKNTKEVKK